jgi:hypothetical protein
MAGTHRYRFAVLGRYPARMKGNATAVTVNVASGEADHLVHCGTLTLAETEWDELLRALRASLGDRVQVEDHDRDRGTDEAAAAAWPG